MINVRCPIGHSVCLDNDNQSCLCPPTLNLPGGFLDARVLDSVLVGA